MALHSRHIAYLMAATLFTVLQTSCRKEKDLEVSQEIVLSASLDDATRGVIASADALKSESSTKGTGIGVFGYKTNEGVNPQQIFSDTKVTYSSGDWTYSPKKFWDKYAYYHFAAYWPNPIGNGMSVSNNAGTHTMTISDIPNWQVANDDASDILLAYNQKSAAAYLQENNGEVPFKFKHMLAQVIIKAWYFGNEDNKPYITKLSLDSVSAKSGTSSIDANYSTQTTEYTGPASGDAILMINASGDAVQQYFDTEEKGDTSKLRTTMCTWLAVPYGTEATANVPISINYKFGTDGSDQNKAGRVPLGHLEAGSTYIVTLKFDTSGEKLNLQAIIVQKWIKGTDKEPEVYNW